MSQATRPISEEDLHAYVDGWLDPERAALVEVHLEADPDDAARVAAYSRQNQALRETHAAPSRPTPERLMAAARGGYGRGRRRIGWRAAAGVALPAVGLGGGWLLRGALPVPVGVPSLARSATLAHRVYAVEIRHPVEVAAEEAHLVAWLSKRLGQPLSVPDLSGFGFRLMGGRLLPGDAGPAAQFMYEDVTGRRITCYIMPNPAGGETAFRYEQDGGLAAFAWLDGPLGFALVGDAGREEMLRLARAVYREIGS